MLARQPNEFGYLGIYHQGHLALECLQLFQSAVFLYRRSLLELEVLKLVREPQEVAEDGLPLQLRDGQQLVQEGLQHQHAALEMNVSELSIRALLGDGRDRHPRMKPFKCFPEPHEIVVATSYRPILLGRVYGVDSVVLGEHSPLDDLILLHLHCHVQIEQQAQLHPLAV